VYKNDLRREQYKNKKYGFWSKKVVESCLQGISSLLQVALKSRLYGLLLITLRRFNVILILLFCVTVEHCSINDIDVHSPSFIL